MKEIEVEIRNEAGLHARPSSLFVQIAGEYDANITVVSEGEEVIEIQELLNRYQAIFKEIKEEFKSVKFSK